MEKKKKIILIIIGIIIVGSLILLYFLLGNSSNNSYPKEPLLQKSLGLTSQKIALGETKIEKSDGALYTVSKVVMLEKVEAFVQAIDSKMQKTAEEKGSYYRWGEGVSYVIYDLADNTVSFYLEKGITWSEADITNYSFAQFVKQYFNKTWDYGIANIDKKSPIGGTAYYANRKVGDYNVEMVLDHWATDSLVIKDGKIIYGKILLTEFLESENKVPLISSTQLNEYINYSSYPKEIYPSFMSVQTTVLAGIDYKSDEFIDIIKTQSNCKSSSSSIVYLYKSLGQVNLTPVYKLDLQCEITYKKTQYAISAVGYVNAIDPEYVSTEE